MVESVGYYWVNNVDGLRTGTPAWQDYLSSVTAQASCNIVMAGVETIPDGRLLAEARDFLARARLAGVKVTLDLGWHRLVNDPRRQADMLAQLPNVVDPGDANTVVYSFSIDEPDPAGATQYRDFTQHLREKFPFIRNQVVYSTPNLDTMVPNMNDFVDDIGFDFYFWTPDSAKFEHYYDLMEKVANRGQRLWLFPETFIFAADVPANVATRKEHMRRVLAYYHEFARTHSRIYGVMYFTWNAPAGGGEIGMGLQQFMDPADSDFDAAIHNEVVGFGNAVKAGSQRAA